MECTRFVEYNDWIYEDVWKSLCRCPICKGWLPQDFPIDTPFKCKKCGTELMTFPEEMEEGYDDYELGGKICPISNPQSLSTKARNSK